MKAETTTAPAEQLRDTIVAAVSQKTGVPAEEIMSLRQRGRRAARARAVAMWVIREVLEQGDDDDETDADDLFGTRMETFDNACWYCYQTPELLEIAQEILGEHRPPTSLGAA